MLYIGLMSGTSMDAVDAVLLSIGAAGIAVQAHHANPIPISLRKRIHQLSHPGEDSVALLGEADRAIGNLFAQTALELLDNQGLPSTAIAAIGSHGQTIRHAPPSLGGLHPYTVQIGDPNLIAATTGITTIADFRRKDLALGGEGAPLVPAFHQTAFQSETRHRAIINIGGIANITWLPSQASGGKVIGFDTGPGNCLMDAWIQRHHGDSFDCAGAWAASGTAIPALLTALSNEPFLRLPPPKSTGKELFNLPWLEKQPAIHNARPEDVQATLCRFTAETIALGITACNPNGADEIFLCGGGALNQHLITLLQQCIPDTPLQSTAACGIDPMHVEAAAFAWLAHQTLNRLPGNLPDVTGARRPAILGGIYLP